MDGRVTIQPQLSSLFNRFFYRKQRASSISMLLAGSEPVANFHLQSPGRSTVVHELNINRNKKSKSRENHCANNAMANWAKIAQTRLLKWPYANVRLVCAARSLRIHAEQGHDNEAGAAGVNKKRRWLKTAKRKSFYFFLSQILNLS